jgi:hypothetical protein
MSGARQVFLGFFMALLSSAIVLGSLSLSLLEGGYTLAQAPATGFGEMVFSGEQIWNLAQAEMEGNAPGPTAAEPAGAVILTPVANSCVHPQGWIKIIVRPEHSLRTLAHLYDTSVHLLKTGNCMMTESLVINSELYVPPAPPRTATPRPRPTYWPPSYWTPYPTVVYYPTRTPWVPTPTQFIPPTQPPTPLPTAQPTLPTPYPTAPPTQPLPTQPLPTLPPPTDPPPPTSEPPTPVPPTPQPQPTSLPPPQSTSPPPPTSPPPEPTQQLPPQDTPAAPSLPGL